MYDKAEAKRVYDSTGSTVCRKGDMDEVLGIGLVGGAIFKPEWNDLPDDTMVRAEWNGHHDFIEVVENVQ